MERNGFSFKEKKRNTSNLLYDIQEFVDSRGFNTVIFEVKQKINPVVDEKYFILMETFFYCLGIHNLLRM